MATGRRDTHPNYDQTIVESLILEVAAQRHPARASEEELIGRVVTDSEDAREVETARKAIGGLREYGLATARAGRIVELTPAALHAYVLLKKTGPNR